MGHFKKINLTLPHKAVNQNKACFKNWNKVIWVIGINFIFFATVPFKIVVYLKDN